MITTSLSAQIVFTVIDFEGVGISYDKAKAFSG